MLEEKFKHILIEICLMSHLLVDFYKRYMLKDQGVSGGRKTSRKWPERAIKLTVASYLYFKN